MHKNETQNQQQGTVTITVDPTEPCLLSDISEQSTTKIIQEDSNRYSFLGEKGRGGIGKVLIAYDQYIGRQIAVKELLTEKWNKKDSDSSVKPVLDRMKIAEARFLKEAKVTGQLEHPGIVPVYEIGKREDGTIYYTMRLVKGNTLYNAIKNAKSLKERLRLLPHFRDLCNTIAYAHSRGVVHRDIKPENIMIGEFGETVVLDWGLVKIHGEKDDRASDIANELKELRKLDIGKTLRGKAMGTPAYMSPEQARGEIDLIDERSDIYSLGAVLFEILTGETLFNGTTVSEIISKVINGFQQKIQAITPDAPLDLCAVAEKSLKKDKLERYPSAVEVAREIENYMAGGRVTAYEYSSLELFQKFVYQNKALSSAIAVLLFVFVFSSVAIYGAYRDSVENERMAHLNLALGYQENADRLIKEMKYDKARIFSAAALYHNPFNPFSPYHFPDIEKRKNPEADEQIMLAQSSLYISTVNKNNAYIGKIAEYDSLIIDMDYSSDGKYIAMASKDHLIRIWNRITKKNEAVLRGHTDEVRSIAFSKNSKTMISASWDKSVRLWDISGNNLAVFKDHTDQVLSTAFSPDSKTAATGSEDGQVILWDIEKKSLITKIKVSQKAVNDIVFSPDGKYLLTATVDGEISVWNITENYTKAFSWQAHSTTAVSIKFTPDGKNLVSAGYDRFVKVWDGISDRMKFSVQSLDVFYDIDLSSDGKKIAAAGRDGTIKIIDIEKEKEILVLRGHESEVLSVAFKPDSTKLASSSSDKTVKEWEINVSKTVLSFDGHKTYIPSVVFSNDNKYMASSSWDKTIKLWDRVEEKLLTSINVDDTAYSLKFTKDSRKLIAAGNDKKIRILQIPDLKTLEVINVPAVVYSIQTAKNDTLLIAGVDKSLIIWDISTKEEIAALTGHKNSLRTVALSPDETIIATAGRDGSIILWDLFSKKIITTLVGHKETVLSLNFSRNGKYLLSAGDDKVIKVWDITNKKLHKTLANHTGAVHALSFSADGNLLISIGQEAMLWDASDFSLLQKLDMDYTGYSALFTSDSNFFAISDGPNIRLYPVILGMWKKNPAEILSEAEKESDKTLEGFRIISK